MLLSVDGCSNLEILFCTSKPAKSLTWATSYRPCIISKWNILLKRCANCSGHASFAFSYWFTVCTCGNRDSQVVQLSRLPAGNMSASTSQAFSCQHSFVPCISSHLRVASCTSRCTSYPDPPSPALISENASSIPPPVWLPLKAELAVYLECLGRPRCRLQWGGGERLQTSYWSSSKWLPARVENLCGMQRTWQSTTGVTGRPRCRQEQIWFRYCIR